MKPVKIVYFKTFPINQCWEKLGLEAELADGEDPRKAFYEAKKIVENFYYESTKADEKKNSAPDIPIIPNAPLYASPYGEENICKPTIEQQIESCSEVKVLESYKFIVKGKADLEKCYLEKYNELTTCN